MSTTEFNNQFIDDSLFDELFPIATDSDTNSDAAEFIVDINDNN